MLVLVLYGNVGLLLCSDRRCALITGRGIPSSPGRAYPVTVRRFARRLVAPALIAASLAAFVVTGLHAGETPSRTPSKARVTNPYIDTRTGCEHLIEGCTVGQKRANQGTGQRLVWVQVCEDGARRRVPCPRSGSSVGGSTYHRYATP